MSQQEVVPATAPVIERAIVHLPASAAPGSSASDWAFAPVAGIPLIRRNLMALKAAGIRRVHLVAADDEARGAWQDLAVDDDDRLPEIELGLPDAVARVLVLDGRRLFHQSLLADAATLRSDAVYVNAAGRSAGLQVDSAGLPDAWRAGSGVPTGAPVRTVEGRWCPVAADTPDRRKQARRALLASLTKDTDGWVSRHLNRPVSTRLSARLSRYPVHPNVITLAGFLVAVLSAYASALGTYAGFAAGGVLFQAASVLDGVDGEVARLTFRSSRRGQWLDTIADDASNLVYFAGLTLGVWRASMSAVLWYFGVATVVLDAVAVGFLYWHLVRHYDSATLLAYQPSLEREATRSTGHWLALKLQFMSRRDSYALLIMCGSLAGVAWVTLVVTPVVIAAVLVAAAFLVRGPAAGPG